MFSPLSVTAECSFNILTKSNNMREDEVSCGLSTKIVIFEKNHYWF
jgi:hypothetical protein